MGRTVGRICSVRGTSLTVYFSSVVTCSEAAFEAVEGVVEVVTGGVAGGGVDDCAFNPAQNRPAEQRRAALLRNLFVEVRFIITDCGSCCWNGVSTRHATP